MNTAETQTSLLDLMNVIQRVEKGEWKLPEFQRDFVWSDNDIRALLATALSDWPMGSLLLMDGSSDTFVTRSVEGASQGAEEPSTIILDGQQRVTSLFHAFRDKGRKVFAIKWDEDFDKLDDPEEIISYFSKAVWRKKFGSVANQAQNRMLPFSVLGSASEFFEWRDEVLDCYTETAIRALERERLSKLYGSVLSHLHKYRIPAVTLESSLEPQAISRIFERVNKSGIRLSTFDLMVAKTYLPTWNLRDQWADAKEQFPNLARYLGDDGLPVLQAISLKSSDNLRQAGVLKMSGDTVRENWQPAIEGMDRAVDFVARELGAFKPELQPYPNMLPVIAAIAMNKSLEARAGLIKEWFWTAIFSGAIDSAANTRLVSHYKALLSGTPGSIVIGETNLDLRKVTKYSNKALHRGLCCFIGAQEIPNELRNKSPLLVSDLEPMSMFSKRDLESNPEYSINSIINTMLAPSQISKSFGEATLKNKASAFKTHDLGELFDRQVGGDGETSVSKVLEGRARKIADFLNENAFGNATFILGEISDEDS